MLPEKEYYHDSNQDNEEARMMAIKPKQAIIFFQTCFLTVFLGLTFMNEFLDIPHFFFGDQPTTWDQRKGEIVIELVLFLVVVASETWLTLRLIKRIKILEGILPICSGCKRIRHQEQWLPMEAFISGNSMAQFSHSLCPQCL